MTRRHIEAIAGALRASKAGVMPWTAEDQHEIDCNAVATAIRGINPSFDVKRFLTDCGVNI